MELISPSSFVPRISDDDFEKVYRKITNQNNLIIDAIVNFICFIPLLLITTVIFGFIVFYFVDQIPFGTSHSRLLTSLLIALVPCIWLCHWIIFFSKPPRALAKRILQYGVKTDGKILYVNGAYIYFFYNDDSGREYRGIFCDYSYNSRNLFKSGDEVSIYYLAENPKKYMPDCLGIVDNAASKPYCGNLDKVHLPHNKIDHKELETGYLKKVAATEPVQLFALILPLALFLAMISFLYTQSVTILISIFLIALFLTLFSSHLYKLRKMKKDIDIILNGNVTDGWVESFTDNRNSSVDDTFSIGNTAVRYKFYLENGDVYSTYAVLRAPVKECNRIKVGAVYPVYYLKEDPAFNFIDIYCLTYDEPIEENELDKFEEELLAECELGKDSYEEKLREKAQMLAKKSENRL